MTRPRDVWAEINARPSSLRRFGSALASQYAGNVERCPRIGRTRRLLSEPPCPSCGNKSAWRCECDTSTRDGSAPNKPLPSNQ